MKSKNTFNLASDVIHLVTWFGNPILRTPGEEIPIEQIREDHIQALANRLIYTIKEIQTRIGLGRGLAAPQIGESKRMFVILVNDRYEVMINPRITDYSMARNSYPEICLSCFPLAANVIRPSSIRLQYYDLSGHFQIISVNSMLARVIQHESDHLDGILFTDRAEHNTIEMVFDLKAFKENAQLRELNTTGGINAQADDGHAQ